MKTEYKKVKVTIYQDVLPQLEATRPDNTSLTAHVNNLILRYLQKRQAMES